MVPRMKFDVAVLEEHLSRARRIAVVSHFNPDGDAVGSVSALCAFLEGLGKETVPLLPNRIPSFLRFLDRGKRPFLIAADDPARAESELGRCDLLVCLDFNALQRTDVLAGPIARVTMPKLLIDHHIDPQREPFDRIWSDPDSSSTCELLFWLLLSLPGMDGDASRLPAPCAEALYAGMMTDTNNFANSVRPSTFEMASRLIACGVDKTGLQYRVLNSYSENRFRLMGHLLKENLRLLPGQGVAYMLLSQAEKDAYGFQPGDTEGFVNLPLQIDGVRLSAIFSEDAERGNIRVSLRSRRGTDVNVLARRFFYGGGHENAAGGKLELPLEEVPAYFLKALELYFG